jgi:hypothetical protein
MTQRIYTRAFVERVRQHATETQTVGTRPSGRPVGGHGPRLNIVLGIELKGELVDYARLHGVPVSGIVRLLIRDFLVAENFIEE